MSEYIIKAPLDVKALQPKVDEYNKYFGITDLYKFEDDKINQYLGGGFGHRCTFEEIIVAGKSNVGKSLFIQNMLIGALRGGAKAAYISLEDEGIQTQARLERIIGREELEKYIENEKLIIFANESIVDDRFGTAAAIKTFDFLYGQKDVDIIFLDHVSFLIDSIYPDKGMHPMDVPRDLMRKINTIMKKHPKTLVMVSHVNKKSEKEIDDKLDMILGSSAIAQVASTVLYVSRDNDRKTMQLELIKSRNARRQWEPIDIMFDENLRLRYNNFVNENVVDEAAELI